MRLRKSPTPIKRIGHGVLGTPKVSGRRSSELSATLGFLRSDDVYAGDKDHIIGSFNRCDRGDEYVDHHTLFCVDERARGTQPRLLRGAEDVDAVFKDHEYLTRLGKYERMWGVGRHLLGSQGYRYFGSPLGPGARALGGHGPPRTRGHPAISCPRRSRSSASGGRTRRSDSSAT